MLSSEAQVDLTGVAVLYIWSLLHLNSIWYLDLCRNADSATLQQAVEDALLRTHVHPEGIEGAFVQAAAVAALCKSDPGKLTLPTGHACALQVMTAGPNGRSYRPAMYKVPFCA